MCGVRNVTGALEHQERRLRQRVGDLCDDRSEYRRALVPLAEKRWMWECSDPIEVERKLIMQALEETRWNRTVAAQRLGLTFRSMRYRLKKLGLD